MIDACGNSGHLWAGVWNPLNKQGLSAILTGRHFLHCSWNRSGSECIASDRRGTVLLINVKSNKWRQICHFTSVPCLLQFGLERSDEFLVAFPDCQIKCFNTSGKLMSIIGGHAGALSAIRLSPDGKEAITVSSDVAQVWNLSNFERLRRLNIKPDAPLSDICYLSSELTVTAFKDSSLFVWKGEQCQFQIVTPPDVTLKITHVIYSKENSQIIAAGKSEYIHIYSLEKRKLVSVMQINGMKKVKTMAVVAGMPEHLFLLADGLVRVLNITDCHIQMTINSPSEPVFKIAASNEWISVIKDDGCLELFHLPSIKSQLVPMESDIATETVSGLDTLESTRPVRDRQQLHLKRNSVTTGRINTKPPLGIELDRAQLRSVLKGFGEFPARYRFMLWRHLLKLPENKSAYETLLHRGTHPAFNNFDLRYPIKSQRLCRAMERCLNCVAHWNGIFGELDYIPVLIFPFVKLFQHSGLHAFEMIISVLFNWSRDWFSFYPNPPIPLLASIENVIAEADPRLVRHLTANEITSQIYAWPLMQTMFSEVLPKDDWLVLFDHIFFHQPGYFFYCIAAYILCARGPLLAMSRREDFQFFFHHRNSIPAKQIIEQTSRLMRNTPKALDLRKLAKPYQPLSQGHYPILNQYPKFVVDYRKRETEKIKKREIDILRNKSNDALSMHEHANNVQDLGTCTILTQSEANGTVTEEINFTQRRMNTDFARGVEEASRARKILLASFAS